MRPDLLFITFAIPTYVCAVMLGDSINLSFKAAVEAESMATAWYVFLGAVAAVIVLVTIITFIVDYCIVSDEITQKNRRAC